MEYVSCKKKTHENDTEISNQLLSGIGGAFPARHELELACEQIGGVVGGELKSCGYIGLGLSTLLCEHSHSLYVKIIMVGFCDVLLLVVNPKPPPINCCRGDCIQWHIMSAQLTYKYVLQICIYQRPVGKVNHYQLFYFFSGEGTAFR